ncbi:octopamine receptor beta-3r [Plakobranchus ocellatus]|uniref:Octopamine receptor beta-3r n=1 Tax=Plakobranchus ocellatus TaxID=259542 RepID=A0AAV3ZFY0_9GAST|nr:octopamine receptor beta-3r [Plakobranchus ocellatus]
MKTTAAQIKKEVTKVFPNTSTTLPPTFDPIFPNGTLQSTHTSSLFGHKSDAEEHGADDPHVTLVVFGMLLSACAISVNIITILTLCRTPSLRTMSNLYMASLAVSDFLVGLTLIPFTVFQLPSFRATTLDPSTFLCHLLFGACLGLELISTLHITLIAIDRYIYIVRPYVYPRLVVKKSVSLTIGVVWMIGLVFSIIPHLVGERKAAKCIVHMVFPKAYGLYSLFLVYFVLTFVDIVLYGCIVHTAWRQRTAVRTAKNYLVRKPTPTNTDIATVSDQHQREHGAIARFLKTPRTFSCFKYSVRRYFDRKKPTFSKIQDVSVGQAGNPQKIMMSVISTCKLPTKKNGINDNECSYQSVTKQALPRSKNKNKSTVIHCSGDIISESHIPNVQTHTHFNNQLLSTSTDLKPCNKDSKPSSCNCSALSHPVSTTTRKKSTQTSANNISRRLYKNNTKDYSSRSSPHSTMDFRNRKPSNGKLNQCGAFSSDYCHKHSSENRAFQHDEKLINSYRCDGIVLKSSAQCSQHTSAESMTVNQTALAFVNTTTKPELPEVPNKRDISVARNNSDAFTKPSPPFTIKTVSTMTENNSSLMQASVKNSAITPATTTGVVNSTTNIITSYSPATSTKDEMEINNFMKPKNQRSLAFFMTMSCIHVVCLTPVVVYLGLTYQIKLPRILGTSLALSGFCNSAMNFVVFLLLQPPFRKAVVRQVFWFRYKER